VFEVESDIIDSGVNLKEKRLSIINIDNASTIAP